MYSNGGGIVYSNGGTDSPTYCSNNPDRAPHTAPGGGKRAASGGILGLS